MPAHLRPYLLAHPALGLIGDTPLFRVEAAEAAEAVGSSVWAKAEWLNPGGSVKDRPVRRMLLEALASGALRPGQTILDSSSGNAGIAYAMLGAMLGHPVELVVPGNASRERLDRIRAHGATLLLTDPLEGYDEALRTCHRRAAADPEGTFHCDQYANPYNWRAHHDETAVELLEQLEAQAGARPTHFVAGIGTGGTITGVGRRLKALDPGIQVVAVIADPFPGIEGLKPLDRPEDIRPAILDESLFDARVRVGIDDAYDGCQRLARRGLFVGQSSGAFLLAAERVAAEHPGARVVTVFPDLGERYFSTRLWEA